MTIPETNKEQWYSKGGNGGGPPCAAKLHPHLEIWEGDFEVGKKIFMGRRLLRSWWEFVNSWKNLRLPKKAHQKFLAKIGNKIWKG